MMILVGRYQIHKKLLKIYKLNKIHVKQKKNCKKKIKVGRYSQFNY